MSHLILNENTRVSPDESGAARMRNRCAFTSRDMAADWPEAFVYAVVFGWDRDPLDVEEGEDLDGSWREMAERYGWDDDLIAFLKDAHQRFAALPDETGPSA